MGYTKQMPMTGPAGQGETTPTTTDTPITTDLTGAKVTTGGRRGPKGSTPTPEKVDYSTYDGEQLLEAFDKNRKTRIALTALGAVNPMIALFGQGATRAQEKEIIAAMDKLGIKPPENEATVLDNITDFVSGLFGKDKQEVKNTMIQKSDDKPSPFTQPGYQRKIERERSSGDVSKATAKEIRKSTKDVTIKGRTDSSGKKAGDKGYKSKLRERQEKKQRNKAEADATAASGPTRDFAPGGIGVNKGGLMNKKGKKK
jgi:hypothetical protein